LVFSCFKVVIEVSVESVTFIYITTFIMYYERANLSLGGTTKNVTPQISKNYLISGQHRTHIKKTFHSKLFIKRLPKSCRIQNSNWIYKKNCFDVENKCIRKKFQECHMRDFFYQEQKRNLFFGNLSWMLIFKNSSNANLLGFFYR
jgi:hypothetical protein